MNKEKLGVHSITPPSRKEGVVSREQRPYVVFAHEHVTNLHPAEVWTFTTGSLSDFGVET